MLRYILSDEDERADLRENYADVLKHTNTYRLGAGIGNFISDAATGVGDAFMNAWNSSNDLNVNNRQYTLGEMIMNPIDYTTDFTKDYIRNFPLRNIDQSSVPMEGPMRFAGRGIPTGRGIPDQVSRHLAPLAPRPVPVIDPDQRRRAERNWGGPGFTQGGPIEPEFISTPEGLIPANSHLIPVGYGEGQVDPGFGINKRAYQSGYFNDDDDLRGPMGIAEGFTEGVQGGLRDTRSDWQKWRDSIESVRR